MGETISFTVPGDPVAKGRPRVGRDENGRPRAFTPERTARFEARVREAAALTLRDSPPLVGLVELRVCAVWTLAPSHWRKREPVPAQLRGSAPDADNVLKAVSDALNGIAYLDDRQVARATVEKWDSAQGEAGYTAVTIAPLGETS